MAEHLLALKQELTCPIWYICCTQCTQGLPSIAVNDVPCPAVTSCMSLLIAFQNADTASASKHLLIDNQLQVHHLK